MSLTVEQIDALIAKLNDAKVAALSGSRVEEVNYAGRKTVFTSPGDISKLVAEINAEIARLVAEKATLTGSTTGRRRAIRFG